MALPAHLAKYDTLIDVMVDAVVRELEAGEITPQMIAPQRPGKACSAEDKQLDEPIASPQ
jgi:hypothetical protein